MLPVHANIAAGLQNVTEHVILSLAEFLHQEIQPQTDNICLAGGVALNCQANARLAQLGPFDNIFIPPHCNDAGTSIGAALYLDWKKGGDQNARIKPRVFSPFWVQGFTEDDILHALGNHPYEYERLAGNYSRIAELLASEEVVANFQGPAEIGPRALGNRSILAAPDTFMIKEIMNFRMKRREFFRPLAPIVLIEHLDEYFELPFNFSPALHYMLMTLKVRPEKLNFVQGATHIDGTARVQVVDKQHYPQLHQILSSFYELTKNPVLLNTSFNHLEPIVHTPEDALRTFGKISALNYLLMDDFLIRKTPIMFSKGFAEKNEFLRPTPENEKDICDDKQR